MKLLKIKYIVFIVIAVVAFLPFANASAQSCSGGTTIISSVQDTQQGIEESNSCLIITPSGAIVPSVGTSQLIYALGFLTGISIANYGNLSYSLETDFTRLDGIINADSAISSLINAGTINVSLSGLNILASGISNLGAITALTNTGTIVATATGLGSYVNYGIYNEGDITTLNNLGEISTGDGGIGINNELTGTITSLNNAGMINSVGTGILNIGTITTLTNLGTISAGAGNIAIDNTGEITTLNNFGTILVGAGGVGIVDTGTITTLNNAQGGNGASPATTALTYGGDNLPANYNILINSATHYGQLAANDPSLTPITNFGIYGAPLITTRTYASVLSGTTLPTGVSSGTYDNMTWSLVENGTNVYDLTFIGASLVGTQQSLVNTANALQPIYTLQNSVLANSFSYDCSLFGPSGVCISAGGRNTALQAANGLNNTSGLLIASYRLDKNNSRIGAYADQNLSVNNAGSTVNLGNNTPLVGLFGVWSERPNGIGGEVKVSAAYGQKDATITRQVVGLSEAGSGSSQLNSQGAQVAAKYGFGITENTVLSPYVGMRYTQNNMGGYTEGSSSTVTAPLTYCALNTNATTALAGIGARHRLTPKTMLFASAGVESDTDTSNGTYSATGINGLTPVNFNSNPATTRPTASVGATYLVEKNQQLGLSGIYRQEAYQAVSTTSMFLTYTIGL